jgi:hypothetical protein
VVLEHVPLDLPACAGIVTGELQAPLGHVAVLATNRGTPNMALREGFRDPRLRALEGRLVRLRVTRRTGRSRPPPRRRPSARGRRRPALAMTPPRSLTRTELVDVARLRYRDVDSVGAKAAQLGVLAAGGGRPVPRAFAIPFSAYVQHFRASGAEALFQGCPPTAAFRSDPARATRASPPSASASSGRPSTRSSSRPCGAKMRRDFATARVRFRSSTNAEDLPGFNGAGLYRSTLAPRDADADALADGDPRGVGEHLVVLGLGGAGVLPRAAGARRDGGAGAGVHRRRRGRRRRDHRQPLQRRPPRHLSQRPGGRGEGGAVTSARGDEVPEQVLYYTYGEEGEFERVSRSSLTRGGDVLSEGDLRAIVPHLRAIDAHFVPSLSFEDRGGRAMDVEFILSGPTRRVVIVQARPITLRYDEGRGFALPP